MERIDLNDGVRIDALGAGVIVRQDKDGTISVSVIVDGAETASLRVAVDADA